MKDYFNLSFKNLRHRGLRSWLTLIGIFIGITAVVSLITLGNGLKAAVNSQFGVESTELITIQAGGLNAYGPPDSGALTPLTKDDSDAIEKLSTIEYTIPRNIENGKLEFNDIVIFGFTTDIPDGEKRKFMYEANELEAETGRLLVDGDSGNVVLGYNFYVDKVGLGKPVRPGDKVLIQEEKFKVVGILEKQGSFIWDNVVLMKRNDLEDLMNLGDEVDLIVARVKDKDLMDKAKENIEKLLRKRRNVKIGEEDFEVSTPEAQLATVNSVLSGIQAFIIIIASLSIFIGAVGIVNTMTTSVLERKKEIGIMKAIGARNSQIFLQFFIESGLLGLIGGAVGVLFGTLIGYFGTVGINNFIGSNANPNIDFMLIGFALLGSFIVGAVSGIAPAMQAAKQNPVEALRG